MSQGSTILLIDDDEVDRIAIRSALGEYFVVVECATGADAIQQLRVESYDCILLDYRLPDVDGLELLKELQAFSCPVVMLSGVGSEEVATKSIKAGAVDYVAKDRISSRLLLSTITSAIREGALRQRLEEGRQELEAFVQVVSHDLKAPVRAIETFGQLVLDEEKALSASGRQKLEVVVDQAARLNTLISDLLEYTTSGRSGRPLQCLSLQRVLDQIRLALDDQFRLSRGTLHASDLPDVTGDPIGIHQLFLNLIGNSIKFQSENRPVIHVSAVEQDGGWLISVKDNGIGIHPKYHQRIFEPLTRLHSSSEYEGSGIGLSICHRVVQQHGSQLTVDSDVGQGATFSFALPACPQGNGV